MISNISAQANCQGSGVPVFAILGYNSSGSLLFEQYVPMTMQGLDGSVFFGNVSPNILMNADERVYFSNGVLTPNGLGSCPVAIVFMTGREFDVSSH